MRWTDGLTELTWAVSKVRIWHHHRVLGRFEAWTKARRRWQRAHHAAVPTLSALSYTLVGDIDPLAIAMALREKGFCAPLQLPGKLVDTLRHHAQEALCRRADRDPERFRIGDVRDGRSPGGQPVAIADVEALEQCPAIAELTRDRTLFQAAWLHLGYPPREVLSRLYWSPRSSLSDTERRLNGQTIDFHYDIERHNALYVYFYLTAADRHSGAHVVVARSHRPKPLAIKLGSTRQAERRVVGRYGEGSVVTLEGKPGFGFLEDPGCFHKVLPPLNGDRLILQLRYI